jgi:FHS family Na+ dependent glucose MFS transporter 1
MAEATHIQTVPGVQRAAGYYLAFITLGLASASIGPVLPRLAEQVAVGVSAVSIIFTARSLGYLFGSLIAGRAYDRLPSHLVMAAGLAVMVVALLAIPAMPVLVLLALIGLALGIGQGVVDVGGNVSMVWVFGSRVAPYMNGLHFFFGAGAFVSPLLIAQAVLLTSSHAWAFRLIALLILPIAAFVLTLPSPVPHRQPTVTAIGRSEPSLLPLMVIFMLVYVAAEVSYGGWSFTYATSTGLADEATAAYLTSLFWGAITLGRLLAIPLAARVSPAQLLGGSVAGAALGLLLVNLAAGSAIALWAGTLITGLSMAAIFPTTIILAGTFMTVTGRVTGWILFGSSVGAMLMPWLAGQLFGAFGPRAVMLAILVDLLALVGLFGILMWRIRSLRRPASP